MIGYKHITGAALALLIAVPAYATDGMHGNGTGARNKALAGAGVANEKDATAISLNPAGLVHAEDQLNMAVSLFGPDRFNSGPQNGGAKVESDSPLFLIPNFAYSVRHDANTVFGLSMYGNGGMNTDYPYSGTNPFGGNGSLGVDLMQINLSAAVAKKYGNLSVGVAPMMAVQIFTADGIQNFAETTDVSVGIAVRGGVEYQVAPGFKIGVAGVTPTYMQPFHDYKNTLFAVDDGRLNLPATIQAGVAVDVMPNMTLMADYKRIFYSDVKAIGEDPQAGFGWDSINVYKVGVEWDVTSRTTLRAGYSYNDNPIKSSTVQQNIIAPATVKHHITAGAMYKWSDNIDLEVAGMYAPENTIKGPFFHPQFGNIGETEIGMSQWELTGGIKWKFGAPSYK